MDKKTTIYIWTKLSELTKGGFFHILSGDVLNKAIAMISSVVIARLVNKTEYGYLSYADNLYAYLSLFAGLGMASALLKFCGVRTDKSKDRAYFRFAGTVGLGFQFVVALALCVVTSLMDIPFAQSRVYIWALILYPVLSYLLTLCQIYLRTQNENKRYAASGIISSAGICIFSISFVLLLSTKGIIIARYTACILAIIYVVRTVFGYLDGVEKAKLSHTEKKLFVKMAIALAIANFFSGIMPLNEALLINHIIADEIVTANFHVAGLIPQLLLLVSGAVNVYFFPIIAQMDDWVEIRKKVHKIGILNFVVIFFLMLAGMACTPLAIRILYGEKYMDAIQVSYLLWCMRGMNCCLRIVPMNMLPAIGKTKFNAWVAFFSCCFQIIIDYFFISRFGISGVAWGATIVYLVSGIGYWTYFEAVCARAIKKSQT